MNEKINEMRWIEAPITIEFSAESLAPEDFKREFATLAESDDDPLSEWVKLARARGETKESDAVMLAMVIDLHRKIDELTRIVKGETKPRLALTHAAPISGLNFTHFRLESPLFAAGQTYYGRISLPVFPMRDVGLFFEAASECVAKKTLMHDRDEKAWDNYVASRERVMIRAMKGNK
ncbi:MAG: hypothetical protein LBU73_10130 [Helicobacteraceae bacterium]|jgi:hypothetical protein|nr:hypothetical protein [Helicobacteraceae bacterium]